MPDKNKDHISLKETFEMYFTKTRRARPSTEAALEKVTNAMFAVGYLTWDEVNYINENKEEVLNEVRS